MVFVACGVSHKSASLDIREQVAFSTEKRALLPELLVANAANEAVVLSTCNRTEIYCETRNLLSLNHFLQDFYQLSSKQTEQVFYFYEEKEALRHTLRVASGLDSMMLGEPQILGQMKRSFDHAQQSGLIKEYFSQLFPYIFMASKRIRNDSGIGKHSTSIAFAATQLIQKQRPNLQDQTVLIIGSGETSTSVAKYLYNQGARKFFIASRSIEHAQRLAEKFGGQPFSILDIEKYLEKADILISATTCPLPFITKNLIEGSLSKRHRPMFLLDLAVPRDIESEVGSLPEVTLCNIDELQNLVDNRIQERTLAAKNAEMLVDVELENYLRWFRTRNAKDLICDYRSQMQNIAQRELERALQKLKTGKCHTSVLSEFTNRLVNKLTHSPIMGLRAAAEDDRSEILDFAKYFFKKNNSHHEEVT
jgi:glutamyl-tRNA reductase